MGYETLYSSMQRQPVYRSSRPTHASCVSGPKNKREAHFPNYAPLPYIARGKTEGLKVEKCGIFLRS